MKKLLFFLPLILVAEIDPFSAGLNSKTPYGLTPTEKAILKNKQNITKLSKEIETLKDNLDKMKLKLISYDETINTLNDRLSALDSILSEIGVLKSQIDKVKKEQNLSVTNYKNLELKVNNLESNITKIQTEITSLKSTIKEITKVQNENFNYLKNAIQEILKTLNKKEQKPLDKKTAYKKAKKLFNEGKLQKAKEYFLYTLSKNYFPATSAFYLGEIAFKNKEYNQALAYYKKSVEIYPKKTSFTDKLLYHSGVSFLKLGNKEAAKLSFQKLIKDYPNSKYSKIAKKELEKLK
ncbi:tetratricopeptide repeat protein [Caminibacter mediatlanticus TB-2]|uniref:TPR repeat n=1 Tax=Caminibacter mediatlanticus TB-2 TaxID=391592 RepID=A0AAI9AIX7_9BACT|nr:tetratricopeptide repeat protein [Caminibacter mediatlanticus]EDM24415.1 TPR repeat [Caminibacter mediatlanticus TB-2]QCT95061.1 tetratricopeptide repeat protein [Caminibacter mediatlanticus TB-2]